MGGMVGLFLTLLLVELVLDVVLFPADEVLVPAEVIGDALLLTSVAVGTFFGNRGSAGRQLGARGSRTSLRRNRRAVSGAGVGLILGAWLFFVAILAFQWWFTIHHPILNILLLPLELLFDLVLFVVAVAVTIFGVVGGRGGSMAEGSREVGSRS
ncbi:MAG TPA: hypothetical protein VGV89_08200 [Thermoplasmata archaeon]|nr:hypothetical protein [Thermoplasmata archaeon]